MDSFFFIIVHVMFPMAAIVGLGFGIQKRFALDLRTLSRFTMYALVPCLVFSRVYDAVIDWNLLGRVFLFALAVMALLYAMGLIAGRVLKLSQGQRMAFGNSVLFFNSGNYGLPLVDLAFHGNPIAVTGQLMVMMIQNILGNSLGVFQAGRGSGSSREALKRTLTMPALYVMAAVFIIKATGLVVPDPVLVPIRQVANGFVGFALFTLGASLPGIAGQFRKRDPLVSSAIKLVLAPLIAWLLITPFGFDGILAQSLVIGMATPTAVNTIIIAREMKNEPDYMARLVFVSTLVSPFTITAWLLLIGAQAG